MKKQLTSPVVQEVTEHGQAVCNCCATIAIAHLSFDVMCRWADGWNFFLSRGIEVTTDDVGRPAVPRSVLGELIVEREADERRVAAERERRVAEAAAKRTGIGLGIPIPPGVPSRSRLWKL